MQIMFQWNDGPGEQLAWMRPRSVQRMASCHAHGLDLVLYYMRHIWKLHVLQSPNDLLGINFHFQINASSSQFPTLHIFSTGSSLLAASNAQ